MIDYLVVVLLFASLPVAILLTFVGCFYCFLFLQHCATYTDEDQSDARSDDSHNTRREEGASTPILAVITEVSLDGVGVGRGGGRERNAYSVSPAIGSGRRGKRLDVDFLARTPAQTQQQSQSPAVTAIADNSTATSNTVTDSDDVPPPPYHTLCFDSANTNSVNNGAENEKEGSPQICISTV